MRAGPLAGVYRCHSQDGGELGVTEAPGMGRLGARVLGGARLVPSPIQRYKHGLGDARSTLI